MAATGDLRLNLRMEPHFSFHEIYYTTRAAEAAH
jgi:hypothetical protein